MNSSSSTWAVKLTGLLILLAAVSGGCHKLSRFLSSRSRAGLSHEGYAASFYAYEVSAVVNASPSELIDYFVSDPSRFQLIIEKSGKGSLVRRAVVSELPPSDSPRLTEMLIEIANVPDRAEAVLLELKHQMGQAPPA